MINLSVRVKHHNDQFMKDVSKVTGDINGHEFLGCVTRDPQRSIENFLQEWEKGRL